jgi:isopenicillin-N N-acyltransferase-like protein
MENVRIVGGIDNIDILFTDLEKMYAFYTETLALPLIFPRAEGDDWFGVQAGAVSLYFFPGVGPHATPFDGNADVNPPAIESVTFEVENLDDAVAALDGKVEWISDEERWDHPSGTWYRFRTFLDPEGNKLGIVEPHKRR